MITFCLAIAALVAGYIIYGKFVDRFFGADPGRPTPAVTKADSVDFKAMPTWKVFVIQFLNIAGLGPIFGAIMGAAYGPAAFLAFVCVSYFMMAPYKSGGLYLNPVIGYVAGIVAAAALSFCVAKAGKAAKLRL